jgi:hypothetical protein
VFGPGLFDVENVDKLVAKFLYFSLDFICVRGIVNAPEDCPKTSVFLRLICMKIGVIFCQSFYDGMVFDCRRWLDFELVSVEYFELEFIFRDSNK